MKKADNFDAGKWLVENKITTQSRLNEDKSPKILKVGSIITPDMWNPSHPIVKKYKSVLTSPHKIEHFMDKNNNIVKQIPSEGWIILSGGAGMGSKFLKTLPVEALQSK